MPVEWHGLMPWQISRPIAGKPAPTGARIACELSFPAAAQPKGLGDLSQGSQFACQARNGEKCETDTVVSQRSRCRPGSAAIRLND